MLKALEIMNDGHNWIVDIDLEKFFGTVNHDKLMTIIGRTIKDGNVISSIRKFLVSGIMIDDEYKPKGIKYLGFGFYYDSFGKQYKARPHAKSEAKPINTRLD